MGSSSSSNNPLRRLLVLVTCSTTLSSSTPRAGFGAEAIEPFPVLGVVQVPQGRWNAVPRLLERLADDVKSEPVRFEILSSAAEQLFRQNSLDESRRAFEQLLRARKPSPSVFLQEMANLRLAEILLLQGQADDALKALEPSLAVENPYTKDEAVFLQARCYLYKRQWNLMNQAITQLLHRNPAFTDDVALNLLRGVAAMEQGHTDIALDFFKHYPGEPASLYYQGVCYIRKGEVSNALPCYQELLQINTRSEWVDRLRLVLGEAFYQAHDLSTAHQFFDPLTRSRVEPTIRALGLHREACVDFEEKKFADTQTILSQLLKEYPKHPLRTQWTYLWASVPIFKKDWKKAIQEQKIALESERGLAPRLHGLDAAQLKQSAEFRILWAHMLLNDFAGCKRLADNFIARYPNEAIASYAYLARGLSLYRMAEYDQALEAYQDLLNKYPESSACGKAVYLMTLCLHSASDPFRMAGILSEVHNRMQKAVSPRADEWTENTLYWVADAYYQLNDLVNAEKIYKEFVLRSPESTLVPYALEALGAAISAQGPQRDGEAVTALSQADLRAGELGNKDFAEQVEIELGKAYFNQRQFARAVSTWDHLAHASTRASIQAEALFWEADALSRQDYFKEAIALWQKVVRNFGGNEWAPQAMMRIGNTQSGLGGWAAAASTFNTLSRSYPNTEYGKEGAFHLIECAFNQGDIALAVTDLLAFSKRYPDDARIPKTADNLLSAFHQVPQAAAGYSHTGKPGSAAAEEAATAGEVPGIPPVATTQGQPGSEGQQALPAAAVARQRKFYVSARDQAQLLKLAPGSAGGAALLWERGAALFNSGTYEPAQRLFEKIMLSYPNNEYAPLAYFYNADCLFWMQKWDEAANAYQNFVLSFPKHERVPNAMFQRAVSLFRKGSYEDAVASFKAFLDKYPNHALAKEAWLNIALSYKKAFQLDKSVAAYRYVIDHYGSDPKVNTVWLQMGSLLEVQGKRSDALRVYDKIAAAAPEYPEALYRRALLYEQMNNAAEARQSLETLREFAQKKNEFRVAALVKLSEIYEQEGLPASKLRSLYEDLRASSADPEIIKQATQRLKELQ